MTASGSACVLFTAWITAWPPIANGHAVPPESAGQATVRTAVPFGQEVAQLRERAEAGEVEAQVTLGTLYESGYEGLPLDPSQAAFWYRRAADKGHVGAQLNLAVMYLEGQGVPRNIAEAVVWYHRAAELGDTVALFSLGTIYETGLEEVPRDEPLAAEWYRRAAEHGFASAQYRLAAMYEEGRGVPRDRSQALIWYRRAADLDVADAQIALGILLSPANGVTGDVVEAHKWFNLAASRWKHEDARVRAARLRDNLAETMTPGQLAEAHRRAAEWQDLHAWPKQ